MLFQINKYVIINNKIFILVYKCGCAFIKCLLHIYIIQGGPLNITQIKLWNKSFMFSRGV